MYSLARAISVAVCAVAMAACKNVVPDADQPAVITDPDDASRAALQQTVNAVLRTDVMLADDALTETSVLIIERILRHAFALEKKLAHIELRGDVAFIGQRQKLLTRPVVVAVLVGCEPGNQFTGLPRSGAGKSQQHQRAGDGEMVSGHCIFQKVAQDRVSPDKAKKAALATLIPRVIPKTEPKIPFWRRQTNKGLPQAFTPTAAGLHQLRILFIGPQPERCCNAVTLIAKKSIGKPV